jgi:hypothetical protein
LVEAIWWHPAFDDDPEHGWFRDLVARAARQAVGGGAREDIDAVDGPPHN